MTTANETPERIRNERDQLRSQVEALRPQCAELKQTNQVLQERVAEFERLQPRLAKAAETAQQALVAAAEEIAKLKAGVELERAQRAESLTLAAQWEKKARAGLARDDESYAALQAIAQVTGRIINRRQGAQEVAAAAEQ